MIPEYIRKRKSLPIDAIKRIRDARFDNPRTAMARDVFMMLFYLMGINMKDFSLWLTRLTAGLNIGAQKRRR